MDGKSIVGLTAAAAVGLWAFLSLTSTQDADRQADKLQMEQDKARFDRDFARERGDKEGEAEAKKRIAKIDGKLGKAEQEAEAKRAIENEARDAVKVEAAPNAAQVVYNEQYVKACVALGKSESECKQQGAKK